MAVAAGLRAAAGTRHGLGLAAIGARLSGWWALELERGRGFLFLPVAMGAGILLYFAAPDEPSLVASLLLAAASALAAFVLRQRHGAALVMTAIAAMAIGFAAAATRTALVAHPVLRAETQSVSVSAWVEAVERRETGDRLTLRVRSLTPAPDPAPDRIRVTSRSATGVTTGQAVLLTVRLRPPADPAAPGQYDFGRDAWFAGYGATGFIIGQVRAGEAGEAPFGVTLRARLDAVRQAISDRIRSAIPGASGAIADALVTGKRDGIPEGLNEAMRAAGTYHILSISGFHMALVAALIFGIVRGGLALVPAIALRHRAKAWAAFVALVVATIYLVISGAEVATQRSWIMIAVVLVGVMLDRGALTLRTLAIAALVVLLVAPESLLGPSFQMSFAATLALIAGYVSLRPFAEAHADAPAGLGRVLLMATNGVAGLATSSFVASLATTPYAAHHFNTVHLYGVAGNLLGAPVIEFFVMPLEILALMLWPFGWDKPVWALAGLGIDLFVRVVEWVASWPGGKVIVPETRPAALLVLSLGLVLVAALSTPLRWVGAPLVLLGLLAAPHGRPPLALVDGDGATVAARAPDGTLRLVSRRGSRFAVQRWLLAEGDRRNAAEESLQQGVRCDALGCAMPLAGGGRIAVPLHPDALADDCREARLVVTRFAPPEGCGAVILDLAAIRWTGAIRLRQTGGNWEVEVARPASGTRPWHRARPAGPAPQVLRLPETGSRPPPSPAPATGEMTEESDAEAPLAQ
ncbi:ComEC/Rec2 family competence protein [Phreatobacter sp.]|uniref:ComEC/Rec2 family competence protein n=1 Tax=Phreatobacter sp. TaxID=1966341 RepID=UPI00262530ED|nr:ComEC/Rec2 family competence protein [Phreatobacter sp.]